MRFRQDLHVAVLTVPGWDVTNLNDSVLEYARSHASDTDVPWISTSNPNYWSDGLVILAVAPDSRKVGCYFGEDVAVTLDQQAAIQDAAKDQYRRADWYGGTVSMAAKTADVIGRPGRWRWHRHDLHPARNLSACRRHLARVLPVAWRHGATSGA